MLTSAAFGFAARASRGDGRSIKELASGNIQITYPEAPIYSSFLVITYILLMEYNILPKQELHSSLWVERLRDPG